MPEPGNIDDSVLSVPVDANLANARPNRGHGLPIARFQSTLHQFQFVAHLLANRLGETPRPFQAVTLPFNRLEPVSHWLQYTRTHIHCEHRASPYSDQLRGLVPIRSLLRRLSCTRYD